MHASRNKHIYISFKIKLIYYLKPQFNFHLKKKIHNDVSVQRYAKRKPTRRNIKSTPFTNFAHEEKIIIKTNNHRAILKRNEKRGRSVYNALQFENDTEHIKN